MHRFLRQGLTVLLAVGLAAAAGCKDNNPIRPETKVSDFSLQDVNPNSARHNEFVSPRDYVGQVSAWYFGHAT